MKMVKKRPEFLIIFLIALLVIPSVFKTNTTFSGLVLLLLAVIMPFVISKHHRIFSKISTLSLIFALGLVANLAVTVLLLQTKDMYVGMALLTTLAFTLIVIPDVFATSLLTRMGASENDVLAFYFLFLLFVFVSGFVTLFALLPTGSVLPERGYHRMSMLHQVMPVLTLYLELVAVPSAFCLLYRRARSFFIFIPMPLALVVVMYLTFR